MNYINYANSYVKIKNSGWYVAQFYLSYYFQGQQVRKDSGLFYIAQTHQLDIPQGASNIHLKVIARSFGNFVTVYNSNIPSTSSSCFIMSGTILNPSIKQVTCTQLGTTPPGQCCCCYCCYK
ncbi:hypothetical protein IRP63_04515 [Clostridium botulinum]|uniref:Uncharacterized protein n=2 Tax=Clostridium botulinum TaxID=1491 RepID=A0A0A0IJN2_CLOBO|nr:hypothetical protein [Clostridium botulinum]KEI00847.1 hypothetical protein Z952_13815 [Clostridium botulinum C/D str. BKT75002]KEI09161.1 hypothetical protein Z954_13555 [Clostridium botulinum C/D str. BKT2873]KGM96210.1 hypothetical protein Z956_03355 [Clostridium botulinum D str. CCUG 7971]KGN00784.1 hypothetical protein Z955_02580 [Clostridium botulinum C/D str. DC5]KOC46233.1 hypothetical protein ADU88_12370 [Clostridium botulinum]